MNKTLRTNPGLRLFVLLLTLVLGTAGFWASFFTMSQWDTLWSQGNYYVSHNCYANLSNRAASAEYLAMLLTRKAEGASLSYLEQQKLAQLERDLSPQFTNFRYRLVDGVTGEVLSASKESEPLINQVYQVYTQYLGGERELVLEYGAADPLTGVMDEFGLGEAQYQEYIDYLPAVAIIALCTLTACILLTVFLCLGTGQRRGREGIVLRLADRIPLDVLALLSILALCILISAADSIFWIARFDGINPACIAGLGLSTLGIWGYLLYLILTLTVRAKAGVLFANTLIWRLCKLIGRGCRRGIGSLPLTWRVVVLFLLYLLGSVLTGLTIFLIPVYQGLVLYALCRWTIQWKRMRAAAASLTAGEGGPIDTRGFYPDLREHADTLNRLGDTISTQVEERLKSERFRAELITNVSHDLKTPLTSILNYVDLLKKEPPGSPRSAEYLQVLERKSQRLKKLTEDLVEASKASTGTLPVNAERLNLVQLVRQSLGEFEEKFAAQSLSVIPTLPQEEIWVRADGRHLWRVVENLLSNCCKYALEGTRIYLEASRREGRGVLTVKNISRQPLNLPAERLMERFVRGDESRSTEGSGLGLSIARSLTQLQGGDFSLEIDGDLFKVTVFLPLEVEAPHTQSP